MIKNLIFDLGGVIIRASSDHNQKFLSSHLNIPPSHASRLWNNGDTLITGEETTEEFLVRIGRLLKKKINVEAAIKSWKKNYTKIASVDSEILLLIEDLKSDYSVYILTDAEKIHNDSSAKEGLYEKFDRVFKSFEEGFRKPDKEAYLNLLNKIHAEPEECVFIDDKEENVKGAENAGIRGIIYIDLVQLKHSLAALRVTSRKV